VNLSAATFKAESVLRLVEEALQQTGLDPALLELELTEGTLMRHQADVVGDLRALRRIGVRIAIDDFGTGYSSLAYLQRLPIDRLKIDRSFTQGLTDGSNGGAIVEAIVGIGRSLEMEVLAEGVETLDQVEQLRALGCKVAQGYLFGRPMSPSEFIHTLQHPRSARPSQAAFSSCSPWLSA
jgi:EAL domain-containing protein (putative c-di-GMP-specific phosphodiesterase class I)